MVREPREAVRGQRQAPTGGGPIYATGIYRARAEHVKHPDHKPTDPKSAPAELRRMYRVALGVWASDLLALRRRGLDAPTRRGGEPHPGLVHWGRGTIEPRRQAA